MRQKIVKKLQTSLQTCALHTSQSSSLSQVFSAPELLRLTQQPCRSARRSATRLLQAPNLAGSKLLASSRSRREQALQ